MERGAQKVNPDSRIVGKRKQRFVRALSNRVLGSASPGLSDFATGPRVCCLSDKRESWCLLVQDNTKKRTMHLQSIAVFDEAKLSEPVHEEIHP